MNAHQQVAGMTRSLPSGSNISALIPFDLAYLMTVFGYKPEQISQS